MTKKKRYKRYSPEFKLEALNQPCSNLRTDSERNERAQSLVRVNRCA